MTSDGKTTTAGRAPRLNEQVASELERRILAGLLTTGVHLTELRLADEFGVSRAPIRGALLRLEQAGLVERAESGRSYVVTGTGPPGVGVPALSVPGPRKLTAAASWQGIYEDVSRNAVARAAFGSWRITETDLAVHYGVSRTVAREVLGRLEHVGIVRKDSRKHWYLPALTPERVGELYEMRQVLEPLALRKAAANVPRPLLAQMRRDLERASESAERRSPQDLDRLERQLHVELLSYADNATLLEALQHYHALLITNAVLYEATSSPFGTDPFIGEHLDIVRSLEAGQPDRAAQQLENHLRIALGRALGRIDHMVRNGALEPMSYLSPVSR
ncbi:MAG TPA: GntR family transcriptional regulator [Azospirillum sp.]|nr:GntR family transcriptional regulator [Azospirillum sp.]